MATKATKDAKTLIAKLQNLNSSFLRFNEYVDSVADNVDNLNDQIIQVLKVRLNAISPKLDEAYDGFNQIRSIDCDTDLSIESFENIYFDTVAKARMIIDQFDKRSVAATPTQSIITKENRNSVKLPAIAVPLFSGDIFEFDSFFDTFKAVVDSNDELSDVEKLFYLKQSLRGSAAECVNGLQMITSNYKIAIDNLKIRYENRKLQVLAHLEALFNFNEITRENAGDLRRFSDTVERHFRGLENMDLSDKEFKAAILAYLIKSKTDYQTASDYIKLNSKNIPSLEESKEFISNKCLALESLSSMPNKGAFNYSKPQIRQTIQSNNKPESLGKSPVTCAICHKGEHFVSHCGAFLEMSPKQRWEKTRNLNLCANCLKHSNSSRCRSSNSCRKCQRKHHTLLCYSTFNSKPRIFSTNANASNSINHVTPPQIEVPVNRNLETQRPQNDSENIPNSVSAISANKAQAQSSSSVLLSTAQVSVCVGNNISVSAKCLLDSGSQSNFITRSFCDKLKIEPKPMKTIISGINGNVSNSFGICDVQMRSLYSNSSYCLQCLVVPTITSKLPISTISKKLISVPINVQLADTTFYESSTIELLIGADTFYELLLPGQIRLGKNLPILQNTTLGYIVSGKLPLAFPKVSLSSSGHVTNAFHANHVVVEEDIESTLSDSINRFMSVDDIEPRCKSSLLSREHQFCESNFEKTTKFESDGKLTVSIPYNSNIAHLGDSKARSIQRFLNLEKRLNRDPALKEQYSTFIHEYQELGHMTEVGQLNSAMSVQCNDSFKPFSYLDGFVDPTSLSRYFLPHHPVFKESLSTSLRVVFDGSTKTTSGKSINDAQIVGPVIQDDLFSILLRFRQFEVAIVADIEKMYRMINIQPNQRHLQSILWRDTPQSDIKIFELNTVTYGMASSSYLATKSLQFIAKAYSKQFPQASRSIFTNFYMDDWLLSTNSVEEMQLLKTQVSQCLSNHGLTLRKFMSNNSKVVFDSDYSKHRNNLYTVPINNQLGTKTLGLNWIPSEDVLFCNADISTTTITKRAILAAISKIYDPLGILSPVVVVAKLIMQQLWQEKVDWDHPISYSIRNQWSAFQKQWIQKSPLKIKRSVIPNTSKNIQLHGFSDASSRAYGACVYVRTIQNDNQVTCSLLCAKSKVSPMNTVSIPRLELCAAVLLTQLMQRVVDAISITADEIFLWTDSTIVVQWIHSAPNMHKVFVANRIAFIHENSHVSWWRHTPSQLNPADLISRGTSVSELKENNLWWNGPEHLKHSYSSWPLNAVCTNSNSSDILELRQCSFTTVAASMEVFDKYSTLTMLQRVYGYVLRFIRNVKARIIQEFDSISVGALNTNELKNSLISLTKLCQTESFNNEIKALKTGESTKLKSGLQALHLFIDKEGCLRVGGRISKGDFSYDKKFPFLLPKRHNFTRLVLRHYHITLLHCGAQHLLAAVREKFWPLDGKNQCKFIIRRCVTCTRVKPLALHPIMSDLPRERLSISYPFYNVGVDFAGPILIREKKYRNTKMVKSYLCMFVCLTTHAVHIELATDLTKNCFINLLKRFISRRGKPSVIWSDNAKNFVSSASHLRCLYQSLYKESNQNETTNFLANQGISWKFITPRAPHEGGMWESAIKSAKFHLKRTLGNTHLDYEDLTTVLIQIESILNSRPLSYLSSDPNDPTPITPGHFLIGRPFASLPESDISNVNPNRLRLFQRAQQLVQHFWKRWQKEVVPEMQRRCKWFRNLPNLAEIGSVVTLQEDGTPPLQWKVGVITEVHRSADNIIRSASVRLPGGSVVQRSVRRMCVLPADE